MKGSKVIIQRLFFAMAKHISLLYPSVSVLYLFVVFPIFFIVLLFKSIASLLWKVLNDYKKVTTSSLFKLFVLNILKFKISSKFLE